MLPLSSQKEERNVCNEERRSISGKTHLPLFFRFLTLAQKAKVVAFVEISRKLLKALMATQ